VVFPCVIDASRGLRECVSKSKALFRERSFNETAVEFRLRFGSDDFPRGGIEQHVLAARVESA
jgi:hypothetical protein